MPAAGNNQWLIVQGRAVGKLLAPLLVSFTRREGLPEQQPQPGACEALYSASVLGALAMRSEADIQPLDHDVRADPKQTFRQRRDRFSNQRIPQAHLEV